MISYWTESDQSTVCNFEARLRRLVSHIPFLYYKRQRRYPEEKNTNKYTMINQHIKTKLLSRRSIEILKPVCYISLKKGPL